ncbi:MULTISPECIES: GDSL-type esterase/lipase family protein [unclassified Leptolyngbya]|uniref:GDSL-type esterase/lipase family protein n=1 Tax=unclassified Leptolyngbya TaxID=2650499 RepID=UPI0016889913|nr:MULTISPECIES: GDSL-type esterase/lipase family protein [unclassified Leptolyngbya]MBD1913678.1 G-D-S-L family lipolytic protein [Leptolyngbya sp. FACHB-8]MBD2157058.1 G-D-S-L family lipolytic protein [Leptolyngbya sp. FACHB-16]
MSPSVSPAPLPSSLASHHSTGRGQITLRQADPSNPLRLIALGDSLVYGFGDPEGGGWVERLRRRWMMPDTPGHVVYNLGIRGDGVRQVLQRLEDEFSKRGELRHRVPDCIILSVGTNDSARVGRPTGRNFTAFDDFENDLGELLSRAQRLCPVIFVGMTPVDELRMPFAGILYYTHDDQYRYKEATRLACEARQIPYLDIFELWKQRGDRWWQSRLSADGLHPNSAGYASLFEDFLAWDCGYDWEPGRQMAVV